MPDSQIEKIRKYFEKEPYAGYLGMKLEELAFGRSVVSMKALPQFNNAFSITHGGAIFSLVDTAFGLAANSYGQLAVALSMSINYISPARPGDRLTAEAQEVSRGTRTANYRITVTNKPGQTVAICQAIAYLKRKKLPLPLKKNEDNT